ncbi:GntR family transcriptional regulator [Microbacterium resistens]|uniref:GntR family transcriptional regulator n=1 Tax=Microbacterium resistens TaxID=156977 RepID=UPI001C588D72|nr:GntR family transcriptional regulator [Microbacterium resistens]MBW1638094.1 GntR family transcriptional regulator [Microbacterium resistens]
MVSKQSRANERELPARPDDIAAAIAQAIREGVYAPGASLIQEDLARRFQVSRSPIREALRILAAEGVVDMPPGGQGASVRMLSSAELAEIYDLRITLEPRLAEAIIENVSGRTTSQLAALADEISAETEISSWMRLNFEFHRQLLLASERPLTSEILIGLLSTGQPYSRENIEVLGGQRQADAEHHEMVAAIRDRDAEKLSALIDAHLAAAKARLIEHYAARATERTPMDTLWAP